MNQRGSDFSSGCRRRSRSLTAGQRKEMGRLVPTSAGLPGLGTGVIIACFQITGILHWLSERLKMWVKYCSPSGPRFLS